MSSESWVDKSLGTLLQRIVGGGTPPRRNPRYWDGAIPWASVKDFSDGKLAIDDTSEHISQEGLSTSTASLIPAGVPVICTRMAVGRCAIPTRTIAINQDLKALYPKPEEIDARFLTHQLSRLKGRLEARAIGSTVKGITLKDLLTLRIPSPGIPVQHRITEILDTLDETVTQTEKLIAKLSVMKIGLLHDLLTLGVNDQGILRDPARNPADFQDSPIGRVPREWEITTLGEEISKSSGLIQTGPFGSQLHAYEYVKDGTPVIMPQDLVDGHISAAYIARVSPNKVRQLGRHEARPGDVIFSRRGDLSDCAPITSLENGWLCGTGCLLVRPLDSRILGPWLAAMYRHDRCQRQIMASAVGSTMMNLNSAILKRLLIARPGIAEQKRVLAFVESLDLRLASEQQLSLKLQLIKNGLADDLLTGRVRVRPLEKVAA